MTKLTPIEGRLLVNLDALPQPSTEERLENLARELMTAASMLRGAELRGELSQAETIERAKRALQAGAAVRTPLRAACEPATVAEVCDRIALLIDSTSQRDPEDGYSGALTTDVGSLQPSRGALEAASDGCAPPPSSGRRSRKSLMQYERPARSTQPRCARLTNCRDRSLAPNMPMSRRNRRRGAAGLPRARDLTTPDPTEV
jgi:hypothetical protein